MTEHSDNDYITIKEAMELLMVCRNTIMKLIKNGDLVATKLPAGGWRVLKSSATALLPPKASSELVHF